MKHTLFIVAISLFASCITSKYNAGTKYPSPFEFQKIDTIPGAKNDLYVQANSWMAKTYNCAKCVLQMQDKEAGKLIGKGVMTAFTSMGIMIGEGNFYVSYTISIDVKDGKYKVVLSDFILTDEILNSTSGTHSYSFNESLNNERNPSTVYPKAWANLRGDCYHQSLSIIESLSKAMKSKADNF